MGHAAGLRRRPRRRAAGPRGRRGGGLALRGLRHAVRRGRRRLHVHGQERRRARARGGRQVLRHLPGRRHRVPLHGAVGRPLRHGDQRRVLPDLRRAGPRARGVLRLGRQRQPPVRGRAARRRRALPHRGPDGGPALPRARGLRERRQGHGLVRRHAPVVAARARPRGGAGRRDGDARVGALRARRVAAGDRTGRQRIGLRRRAHDEAGRAERAGLALRPRRGPEGHDLHERRRPQPLDQRDGRHVHARVRRRGRAAPGHGRGDAGPAVPAHVRRPDAAPRAPRRN